MPHPLRSLRNRLTLIFALIVAGAIGIVYFYVMPRLEDELVTQKLERLAEEARARRRRRSRGSSATGRPRRTRSSGRPRTRPRARAPRSRRCRSAASLEQLYARRRLQPGRRAARRRRARRPGDRGRRQAGRRRPQQTDVGRQALAAVPLIRNDRIRGVAMFADSLADVRGERHADPRPHPRRGRARAHPRRDRGLLRGAGAHRPHQAPRAGGAQGGRRRLLQPDPRGLRRRDRPARRRVRRHAAPARAARHGAQAVHRPGLARAAHADLLPRRLPRAARGRGARRGDARAVPRAAARSGRRGCASSPRSCSTSPAWSRARSSCGPSRRTCASSRATSRRSSRPPPSAHDAPVELHTGREPIEVECDPERVAQVMRILLDNAFVHTPTGTSIRVSAEREQRACHP